MRDSEGAGMSATVEILKKIEELNVGENRARTTEPLRPRIAALVTAGLITATSLKCGPLGLPADEAWLRLTDDGRKLLSASTEPDTIDAAAKGQG